MTAGRSGRRAAGSLTVALDARMVYAVTRRGTGKSLVDLYTTLTAIRSDWRFLMFHQVIHPDPFAGLPNVSPRRIDIRGDRFNLWQDIRLPLAAWRAGADVLHCPANTAPWVAATPVVLTLHDLNPLETAPGTPKTRRWLARVRRSAHRARDIVTPSAYSQRAIVDTLGVPAERVTVNHWAPDKASTRASPAAIDAVRRAYRVAADSEYVLAFGAEDPRKNTLAIIEAWSRIPATSRRGAVLLIIGLQPTALEHARAFAAARVQDGSCLLNGFAADEHIAPLLSGATALCYPSLREGFGLPVLDAFACATPVITSSTTSLPEVAQDAALLVDPTSVDAIADAMAAVLGSVSLQERLREAGRHRVAQFSWDRCARTLARVLEHAAGVR